MHLQLVKDNNDWEIHKLKLELLFSCNWLSSRINIQQSHQHLQQHPVLSLLVTQIKGSTEDIFIHSSGHMLRLQVRLNYMLIFLWRNIVWPTLLSFKVWVINLGSTTLYRPSWLPPSQFLSPWLFLVWYHPSFWSLVFSHDVSLHCISLHLHV